MNNYAAQLNSMTAGMVNFLQENGIGHAILSSGSRSAPLALAFMRNTSIQTFVVSDERSAAYMALGLAKQMKQRVVLVCTSGTAGLNYAPALAEACNQQIPLLVFTADRPSEMIGIGDNQTIFQQHMFAPNIRASFHLNLAKEGFCSPEESALVLQNALHLCVWPFPGPVHINVAMSEPLYLLPSEVPDALTFPKMPPTGDKINKASPDIREMAKEVVAFKRIMILAGMHDRHPKLRNILNKLLNMTDMVFLGDVTSNLNDMERGIDHGGVIFSHLSTEEKQFLKPDLLITFGSFLISKEMRMYFREAENIVHWHIDPYGEAKDTFFKLKKVLALSPSDFFGALLKNVSAFRNKTFMSYYKSWRKVEEKAKTYLTEKIKTDATYGAVMAILEKIPARSVLHSGNSLAVRVVNDLSLKVSMHCRSIEVQSNRGTSGIDGCLSTAVGASLTDQRIHTVLLGDQSFVYDRNALWNKYIGDHLKIIVLNNKGGGIFRCMPGTSAQEELEEYFVNYVEVDLRKVAEAHHLAYFSCDDQSRLPLVLNRFYRIKGRAALLEIHV